MSYLTVEVLNGLFTSHATVCFHLLTVLNNIADVRKWSTLKGHSHFNQPCLQSLFNQTNILLNRYLMSMDRSPAEHRLTIASIEINYFYFVQMYSAPNERPL